MASLSLFYRTARLFTLLSSLVNKAIISLCLVIISSVYCSVADMIPFQHHLTLNPATFNFSRQSHYFCSFTYSWRTSFSLYVSSVKAYHRGLGDLMEEQMSPGKFLAKYQYIFASSRISVNDSQLGTNCGVTLGCSQQQEKLQQCSDIANAIPCKLPLLLSCP